MNDDVNKTNNDTSDFGKRFKLIPTYTSGQNEIFEIVSRLPEQLTSQSVIIHLPLFNKNLEDERIDAIKLRLSSETSVIFQPSQVDTVLESMHSNLFSEIFSSNDQQQRDRIPPHIMVNLSPVIRELICSLLDYCALLSKNNGELFIFRCEQYILAKLNRHAQDYFVEKVFNNEDEFLAKHELQHHSPHIFFTIRNIINVVVAHFFIWMTKVALNRQFISKIESEIENTLQPDLSTRSFDPVRATQYFSRKQSVFGGLVSLLKSYQSSRGIEQYTRDGSVYTDRECIILRDGTGEHLTSITDKKIIKPKDPIDYVSWRRGNSSWNYTMIEGMDYFDNDTRTKDAKKFLSRICRAGNVENNIFEYLSSSRADLPDIWKLHTSQREDQPETFSYNFPGYRLGGAVYYVLDIELLILICFSNDHFMNKFGGREFKLRLNQHLATSNRNVSESFPTLNEFAKFIKELWRNCAETESELNFLQSDMSITISANHSLDGVFLDASFSNNEIDDIKLCGQIISYLCKYQGRNENVRRSRQTVLSTVVNMLTALWKASVSDTWRTWKSDEEDFIASSVIDGRAVYFSNFRPYVEDHPSSLRPLGLTRTFFVDMGMTPFQRGRLVRRLSDIATYRLSCVKDFERIRALGHGLNEIHGALGDLQRRSKNILGYDHTTINEHDRDTHDLSSDKRRLTSLSESVSSVQELMSDLSDFNSIINGGITDRRGSTYGHLARIRDRLGDLREERILGFSTLKEFVERGIGRAVGEIGRTAQRYETLRTRSQQLLAQYTTEINILSASLGATLSDSTNKNIEQVRSLLIKADLLIVVGGTYYLYAVITKVIDSNNVISNAALAFTLSVAVWVLKERWRGLESRIKKSRIYIHLIKPKE